MQHRFVASTPVGLGIARNPLRVLARPKCPACGKVPCSSEEEARALEASVARHKGGAEPVRFYRCPGGSWHWTRRKARESA